MGLINTPQLVKLFAGIITAGECIGKDALIELEGEFGTVDVKSRTVNFDFSDYYAAEMGSNLFRLWVGFNVLIDPIALASIKVITNKIEARFLVCGNRQVNIDPGYLTPAKVVLASSKDFSHRIYLSEGIYGEVTLNYRHKEFTSFEWTYPDYKSAPAVEFFTDLRRIHADQLKELRSAGNAK